jgi:predicted PurR-regulated permease PerM
MSWGRRLLRRADAPAPNRPRPEPAIASTHKQVAFGLIAFAVFILVVYLVRDLMGAFVLGALLAFVIDPAVKRLARHGVPRALATLITMLVGILLVAGLVTLVVPLFIEEVPLLQSQAPGVVSAAQAQLGYVQGHPLILFGYRVDLSSMAGELLKNLGGFLVGQFGTAIGIGIAALGTIAQIGLMLLVAFLTSLDAPRIGRFLRSLAPTSYRSDVDAILDGIVRMLRGYIRGQLLVAALIGVISTVAVWAIGLKYALALGLLAGVTALVPGRDRVRRDQQRGAERGLAQDRGRRGQAAGPGGHHLVHRRVQPGRHPGHVRGGAGGGDDPHHLRPRPAQAVRGAGRPHGGEGGGGGGVRARGGRAGGAGRRPGQGELTQELRPPGARAAGPPGRARS